MHVSRVNATIGKCKSIESRQIIKDLVANELVFAVVGPVGSGTSEVARALERLVGFAIADADVVVIKASEVICRWATQHGMALDLQSALARDTALQAAGEAMRQRDAAFIAVQFIAEIKSHRNRLGSPHADCDPATRSNRIRVYVIDSLKHPAEVALLRRVYQDSFCLVGVVCDTERRTERLRSEKYAGAETSKIEALRARDESSQCAHGSQVGDTFHLADYFVDNNGLQVAPDRTERSTLHDQLDRLLDMLLHVRLVRPESHETGMFHAYGAQMRSACLSRQVGAALVDVQGNVLATGTNEVPRGGGGVYTDDAIASTNAENPSDGRCARINGFCSNTRITASIVSELIESVPELKEIDSIDLRNSIRKTSIGRLIEFSRAVHAEMDAVLSAARKGVSPVGCRLFVTTFPCHYCARHITCAGISEVQYIEPYPKSRTLDLHGDAMTQQVGSTRSLKSASPDMPGSATTVVVRPFVGVAPRLYERVFMKRRSLKNASGTLQFGEPPWASGLLRVGYEDVEARLIENGEKR